MARSRYLSSTEACSELGIRPQTLYSYVSRGLVRSETGDQRRRTRQYHREDIERLRHQKELRAHPEAAAGRALRAGDPVLESALSRIDDDDLHYRGISVGDLARGSTAEEVAALLWTGDRSRPIEGFTGEMRLEGVGPGIAAELAPLSAIERMQALLPMTAAADPAAYATAPPQIHRCGARILRLMTLIAAGPRADPRRNLPKTLQTRLAAGETGDHPAPRSRPDPLRRPRAERLHLHLPHRGVERGQPVRGGDGGTQRPAGTPSRRIDRTPRGPLG